MIGLPYSMADLSQLVFKSILAEGCPQTEYASSRSQVENWCRMTCTGTAIIHYKTLPNFEPFPVVPLRYDYIILQT